MLLVLVACAGPEGLVRVQGNGYFDPSDLDFGEQTIAQVATRPVRFTNTSGDAIQILGVEFDPPTNGFGLRLRDGGVFRNTVVPRGGTAQLEVTFGPDREGEIATTMLVITESLEIPLTLRGRGRRIEPARLEVVPTSIAFTTALVGESATQAMTIKNVGERSGRLVRAATSAPFGIRSSDGTPLGAIELDPDESVALTVTYAPTTGGAHAAELYLDLEEDAVSVPLTGEAVAPGSLSCDRQLVEFGDVARGEAVEAPVRCTASGPYRLAALDVTPGAFEVVGVSPAVGSTFQTFQFSVRFFSRGVAARHQGSVTLVATHGEQTVVDLSAATVDPPLAEVDLRASLAWQTDVDIDIHFVRRPGLPFMLANDCHFEAPTIDWNVPGEEADDPFLSSDITTGPAEEHVTMSDGASAAYEVYAYYNQHPASGPPPTPTTVTIALRDQAAASFSRTLTTCGTLWHVGTIRHDTTPPRFDAVNTESLDYRALASCAN